MHKMPVVDRSTIEAIDYLGLDLQKVPEVESLLNLHPMSEQLKSEIILIAKKYTRLLEELMQLTAEDLNIIESASIITHAGGLEDFSASELDAGDIFEVLGSTRLNSLHSYLTTPDITDEIYNVAVGDLQTRMIAGSNLSMQDHEIQDGDPLADKAIWGHTKALRYPEIIHFIVNHFMVTLLRSLFINDPDASVREIAKDKDALINAIGNVLILKSLKTGLKYWTNLLELWILPKGKGGLGWINPELVEVYKTLI